MILSTVAFTHLCEQLSIPVNGFNCAMLREGKDVLMMMTSSDVNDILGTDYEEIDFMCGVTQLRLTKNGPVLPGEGDLPSIEAQQAEQARQTEEIQRAFCEEHPEDPSCTEQTAESE